MRNNIDRETYRWLFKVLGLLGILLLVVNVFLYFSADPMHQMALKFSSATLFLLFAASLWIRLDYLKAFEVAAYKARKVPMWASVFVFAMVAFYRLF
jgi:hypothetical protein